MNRELINALFCAVNVMRGTAGGFSLNEKANAIVALELELKRLIAQPNPAEG